LFVVPEVLLSQEVPSDEVSKVPEAPTAIYNPLDVVVVLSEVVVLVVLLLLPLFLAQEMTVRLKRNTEKIMSKYLTWFTIGGCGNN
jgi:hypothetical protein